MQVQLSDFELLAVVGRGGYGKVMQVKHKTNGVIYAIKVLRKSDVEKRKQVGRTNTERLILAQARSVRKLRAGFLVIVALL